MDKDSALEAFDQLQQDIDPAEAEAFKQEIAARLGFTAMNEESAVGGSRADDMLGDAAFEKIAASRPETTVIPSRSSRIRSSLGATESVEPARTIAAPLPRVPERLIQRRTRDVVLPIRDGSAAGFPVLMERALKRGKARAENNEPTTE